MFLDTPRPNKYERRKSGGGRTLIRLRFGGERFRTTGPNYRYIPNEFGPHVSAVPRQTRKGRVAV